MAMDLHTRKTRALNLELKADIAQQLETCFRKSRLTRTELALRAGCGRETLRRFLIPTNLGGDLITLTKLAAAAGARVSIHLTEL